MPDGIADDTEETIGDVLYRLEDTLKGVIETVRPIPEHLNTLLGKVAQLELVQATKEIPATVIDVGDQAAETAKSGVDTAGAGISVIPAAASDVLEDTDKVTKTVARGGGSIFHQKIKRRS